MILSKAKRLKRITGIPKALATMLSTISLACWYTENTEKNALTNVLIANSITSTILDISISDLPHPILSKHFVDL